jgi:hypothetical protein
MKAHHMTDQNLELEVLRDLTEDADLIGQLTKDEKAFTTAYEAFRAGDAKKFHAVLEKLQLAARCGLVCRWIRIKECIFLCLELCGPPKPIDKPNPRELAEAIVRITENEAVLRRLVTALDKRDRQTFESIVAEFKLAHLCHLFCHWLCVVRYRLVCRWVCGLVRERPDLVRELQSAGQALRHLLAHRDAFDQAVAASNAGDADKLGAILRGSDLVRYCQWICEWFCSWRCTLACLTFCRPFPLEPIPIPNQVREALEFAKAVQPLARNAAQFERLSAAVGAGDAKTFEAILKEFKLQRYCIQLCHWICSVRCRRFCICVPLALQPWFTRVGLFDIYADIDTASGRANKSVLGVGGNKFAFFGCLELRGFCPVDSPAFPGVAMKYRFLYDKGAGPLPITGNLVCPVEAGSRIISWPQNVGGLASAAMVGTFQTVIIQSAPVPPDPIPPAPGTTWVGPAAHYISPDPATGWIVVDPNAVGGGFQTLLGFATGEPQVAPGGNPIAGPPPVPAVAAGAAVPAGSQRAGTDLSITFEATRVTTVPPGTTADYSNGLTKIHLNNWNEVNLLNFAEFVTGCCTPIDATLTVQFTVDHEEMDAGAWSLGISSCSPSAPGNITPAASVPPDIIVTARGGSGKIVENTSAWLNCSYTVTLTTRPGLTTGLLNRSDWPNSLTFAICGH